MADSKYNLALLHKKRKETDIARQLFLECEQIYTIVYGPHHRETVDAVRQVWVVAPERPPGRSQLQGKHRSSLSKGDKEE